MEYGRRTSWTGRSRPRHVFAQRRSQTLRVTMLTESPASPLAPHAHSTSSTLIECTFRPGFLTFLTGSAPQTEFAVTHSKQSIERFLTGARTAIRVFKIRQLRAQKFTRRGGLAPINLRSRARLANFCTFLTETALQTEFAVTHSKQSTDAFLTETRIGYSRPFTLSPCEGGRFSGIASLAHSKSSNPHTKLLEGRAWLRL
jgi:hypothetical protein